MSTLVAITYPDEYRAAEVLATLQRLQREYLLDLDDACYVTKGKDGKVRLHQSTSLTGTGAASGTLWGGLVGLLFLVPVAGAAIGAASGALVGKLNDVGIDDNWARQLGSYLRPGCSTLFILVRNVTADKVIPEVRTFGGEIVYTNLSDDAERQLRERMTA